ncbi:MAG: biotin/lipoyl-binding protein [Bacteroidales bacterium]|nr:biotin/lipoyl-binding protein [Bacteroidales bacterium]
MKQYKFTINGKEYNVSVGDAEGKILPVNVNGADYQVELENAPAQAPAPVQAAAQAAPAPQQAPKAAAPAGSGKAIKSPLPGIIISVDVKEGQAVKRGQKVAVIEAMKMENDILAESDGTVTAIHVSKGDSVLEGADIVTVA